MELVNPAGKAFFSLRKSLTGCQPVYTEQKAALDREWWIHKGFWYLVAFPICSARQYEILCQKKKSALELRQPIRIAVGELGQVLDDV